MEQKLTRDSLKLLASGKYIALKKSYNQQEHEQFLEGALFTYDLIQQALREKGDYNATENVVRNTPEKN